MVARRTGTEAEAEAPSGTIGVLSRPDGDLNPGPVPALPLLLLLSLLAFKKVFNLFLFSLVDGSIL